MIEMNQCRSNNTRYLVVYIFDPECFKWAFSQGSIYKIIEGIPRNAKLLRSSYDVINNRLRLTYEHISFPECFDGDVPEERYITIEDIIK